MIGDAISNTGGLVEVQCSGIAPGFSARRAAAIPLLKSTTSPFNGPFSSLGQTVLHRRCYSGVVVFNLLHQLVWLIPTAAKMAEKKLVVEVANCNVKKLDLKVFAAIGACK